MFIPNGSGSFDPGLAPAVSNSFSIFGCLKDDQILKGDGIFSSHLTMKTGKKNALTGASIYIYIYLRYDGKLCFFLGWGKGIQVKEFLRISQYSITCNAKCNTIPLSTIETIGFPTGYVTLPGLLVLLRISLGGKRFLGD